MLPEMKTVRSRSEEGGFSFVELIFGAVIIAIATIMLITHLALNYRHVRTQRDRVFAGPGR